MTRSRAIDLWIPLVYPACRVARRDGQHFLCAIDPWPCECPSLSPLASLTIRPTYTHHHPGKGTPHKIILHIVLLLVHVWVGYLPLSMRSQAAGNNTLCLWRPVTWEGMIRGG